MYVGNGATITFASTLPLNSFSGNMASNSNYGTGVNNYGYCYKNRDYYGATIIGSCS